MTPGRRSTALSEDLKDGDRELVTCQYFLVETRQ